MWGYLEYANKCNVDYAFLSFNTYNYIIKIWLTNAIVNDKSY